MDDSVIRTISQIPFLKDSEEQQFSTTVVLQSSSPQPQQLGRSTLLQPHKKVLLPITPDMTPKPVTIPNEQFIRNQNFSASPQTILAGVGNNAYTRSRSRSPLNFSYIPVSSHSVHVRRSKCRDFYQKGFCMRGDKCFYDHGSDPVVIKNAVLNDAVCNSNGVLATSTPHELYVDATPKEMVEAYNPEAPAFARSAYVPSPQPQFQLSTVRSSAVSLSASNHHFQRHPKASPYSVPPPFTTTSFVYTPKNVPVVQTTVFPSYSKLYTSSNSSLAAGFGMVAHPDISKTFSYIPEAPKPAQHHQILDSSKSASTAQLLSVYRKKSELYQMQVDQQRLLLTKAQETEDKIIKLKYIELVKRNEEALKRAKDNVEALSQQIIAMRQKQKGSVNIVSSTSSSEKSCRLRSVEVSQVFEGFDDIGENIYGGVIVKNEDEEDNKVLCKVNGSEETLSMPEVIEKVVIEKENVDQTEAKVIKDEVDS